VVSGHVHIERNCFVGVNATLRNAITVAEFTLIGAGALVMKDTQPRSVYVGARTERFARTSDNVDM
jgi:acetyltransferase-like isoleucine patch superfamily enzyme